VHYVYAAHGDDIITAIGIIIIIIIGGLFAIVVLFTTLDITVTKERYQEIVNISNIRDIAMLI